MLLTSFGWRWNILVPVFFDKVHEHSHLLEAAFLVEFSSHFAELLCQLLLIGVLGEALYLLFIHMVTVYSKQFTSPHGEWCQLFRGCTDLGQKDDGTYRSQRASL